MINETKKTVFWILKNAAFCLMSIIRWWDETKADVLCKLLGKVNSVQEACAKCFVVHLIKFKILQTTWKNKTKNIKMLNLLVKNWKLRVWCSLLHFFHVICKISNSNMWAAKHLAQASCTELTLQFFLSVKLK